LPVNRTIDHALSRSIGFNVARIRCKPFSFDESFLIATLHHSIEYQSQSISIPESTLSVLRKCRMIWHFIFQAELVKQCILLSR
jgi:hypothetical protein